MHRLISAALVFGGALFVLGNTPAVASPPAGTFTVTKMAEAVEDIDANPGDGICATARGECTLRAAIQESNALSGRQTISLPPGEHSLIRAGCCEDAADSGDLDITDDATIVGSGMEETAITEISAFGGVERVFDIREGAEVTISDLTIRDVYMSTILPFAENCGGWHPQLGHGHPDTPHDT